MTRAEVIEEMEYNLHIGEYYNPEMAESARLSIKSLKAWDEVINELINVQIPVVGFDFEKAYEYGKGVQYALDVIERKLGELEND